ncbi:E3 binding domain-containing protein [Macrococcus animalis]|uniref:E3 binding domain-containing protein n=1 Tax=Macrococcus animalis TaxID=3395467 RepID=UPI0039BE6EF4
MVKVYANKGTVIHEGKAHFNEYLELTDEQYENVKDLVTLDVTMKNDNGTVALEDLTKAELETLAKEKGLEVVGTGKDGAVLKDDLLEALK